MINEYAPTYLNVSTKYQKSEVIAKIVAEVRAKSPGGGFVKKDFYSNRWFEVGDEKARDKVGTSNKTLHHSNIHRSGPVCEIFLSIFGTQNDLYFLNLPLSNPQAMQFGRQRLDLEKSSMEKSHNHPLQNDGQCKTKKL